MVTGVLSTNVNWLSLVTHVYVGTMWHMSHRCPLFVPGLPVNIPERPIAMHSMFVCDIAIRISIGHLTWLGDNIHMVFSVTHDMCIQYL